MNWDTLNLRNKKLALTVCSSRYSKVSGIYGKPFPTSNLPKMIAHLGTPKFQVYTVSFSDFKRTENDRVGLLTDLNIHLIALFDPYACKNDLMASAN